jgi:hypothetical protein
MPQLIFENSYPCKFPREYAKAIIEFASKENQRQYKIKSGFNNGFDEPITPIELVSIYQKRKFWFNEYLGCVTNLSFDEKTKINVSKELISQKDLEAVVDELRKSNNPISPR